MTWSLPIGAWPDRRGVSFRVWAANAQRMAVVVYTDAQVAQEYALTPAGDGYFAGHVAGIGSGACYTYRIDDGDPRPDPASRFQPAGVHGPSQVVDPSAFAWSDNAWSGLRLEDAIIYEVHVGTATAGGTFDSLIEHLDDLRDLGVTALELMPVADFPGERNWGYDGVCLFAPARVYGGPEALYRLVDAAHQRGLAVLLDVVYNHLGPDGNYLRQFSTAYFTDRHTTPWGDALNLDGPDSEAVRAFLIANACYWAHEYHIDGLRLDATHELRDDGAVHFLAELAVAVRATLPSTRHFLITAEHDRNEPHVVRSTAYTAEQPAPWGLDAMWADDFHHQIHVALTGERDGYYSAFSGSMRDLATTLRQGWFYRGQMPAPGQPPRGAPADDVPFPHFIYCIQNHDQVGNRAVGDRLSQIVGLDVYRAASTLLLLSPYTPLLFMGQEWAASTPFLYFTDHHAELGKLVTQGRQQEFANFAAFAGVRIPDPQASETFLQSKLNWDERAQLPHAGVLRLYCDLLTLRKQAAALRTRDRAAFAVVAVGDATLVLRRDGPQLADTMLLIVHMRGSLHMRLSALPEAMLPPDVGWKVLFDSEDVRYAGRGALQLVMPIDELALAGPGAVLLGLQKVPVKRR